MCKIRKSDSTNEGSSFGLTPVWSFRRFCWEGRSILGPVDIPPYRWSMFSRWLLSPDRRPSVSICTLLSKPVFLIFLLRVSFQRNGWPLVLIISFPCVRSFWWCFHWLICWVFHWRNWRFCCRPYWTLRWWDRRDRRGWRKEIISFRMHRICWLCLKRHFFRVCGSFCRFRTFFHQKELRFPCLHLECYL